MLFLALLYKDALADCEASHERVIWISPRQSHPGEDVLIKAVSADQAIDQLRIGVDGHYQQLAVDSRGGPPWSLTAAASLPSSSLITIEALAGGQVIDCQKIVDDQEARLPVTAKSLSHAVPFSICPACICAIRVQFSVNSSPKLPSNRVSRP